MHESYCWIDRNSSVVECDPELENLVHRVSSKLLMSIEALLSTCLSSSAIATLRARVEMPVMPAAPVTGRVSRAELAQALTMILFHDLVERVPAAQAYIGDVAARGERVVFDHGAIRTVLCPSGELPPGEAAIARVLGPLGYVVREVYPLPRLRMTGRSWCHADAPEAIAQFFVSELHPEHFSSNFEATVTRVLSTSRDPLKAADLEDLAALAADGALPTERAQRLLPTLVSCFGRQHGLFALSDYEALRAESPEMAWIATEGNAFNHATDRVADVEGVAAEQRRLGRPIKDAVEVSRSGRVRQTAFKAAHVERVFVDGDRQVRRVVPGSFYEFISRAPLPDTSAETPSLDLAFDAGNATGIFAMTSGHTSMPNEVDVFTT
jgi:hypothetical protein